MTTRLFAAAAAVLFLWSPARAGDGLAPKGDGSKGDLPDVAIEQKIGAQVDLDLEFRNEVNLPVKLRDCVNGKPTVLVMAYFRCPMLCTQVLNGLVEAMRGMPYTAGREYNVVTVSFDPKEGPPLAALKKQSYINAYGRPEAVDGWRFLTSAPPSTREKGEKSAAQVLCEQVGFRYRFDPVRKLYDHDSAVIVLDGGGRVTHYLFGIKFVPPDAAGVEQLAKEDPTYKPADLKRALIDASEGKLGTPIERAILMLCFNYDHVAGRYTFAVRRVIQTACVAAVLTVGAMVVVLSRRKRKPEATPAGTPA